MTGNERKADTDEGRKGGIDKRKGGKRPLCNKDRPLVSLHIIYFSGQFSFNEIRLSLVDGFERGNVS